MSTFSPLFRVTVRHSFFRDGTCANLDFVPTESSQRIMENCGIIVRPTPGGIRAFLDQSRRRALELVSAERDSAQLSFRVFCRDPLLMNYTEPPLRTEAAVLFFDTGTFYRKEDCGAVLHPGKFVSDEDLSPSDAAALKDILTARDRLIPPFFLLSVSLQGAHPLELPEGREYRINFKGRETYWKYYLLGQMARNDTFIQDRNNGIEFERIGEQELAGRTAVVFRSMRPLPLAERSDFNFQLRANGSGKILVRRLPVASPNQLLKEMVNGEDATVSEVYVNC